MKVFFFKRRILWLILLGMMTVFGFCLHSISNLSTVFSPSQKEVAIVIDDFGGRAKGIREMMNLPYTLTFAILPFEEFAYLQAVEAMQKGFEIIVHMPFEAINADPRWYGKKYISANSSPDEIRKIIDESFQILPMAVGLSNHMGSKATAEARVMNEVFKELERKNSYYFDSKTTYIDSPAAKVATGYNLPYAERDVFLDNINSANQMRRQLKKLVDLARSKGRAIGIGHVGPTGITLANVLSKELPKYEKEGFHFVPLSELVYPRVPTKPHKNKNIIIGIDPGHGGIDSGTKWGTLLEKDLNLKFGQTLAAGLVKKGYQVVLSRNEDQLLTPLAHSTGRTYKRDDLRSRIRKFEAAGATVMVSIHANWSKLAYHRGPIVYYSANSPVAQKIAQHVQEHLNQVQSYRKLPKTCNYYLLEQAEVPSILIELGFFSNRDDRKLLQDDQYLEQLKSAIINGLEETL